MTFAPRLTIASDPPPANRPKIEVDDALSQAILRLVETRNTAIRTGDRPGLDATYVGLDSRDWSLERDDHERTSYYDWYMNRIERGMGAEVQAIHVVPVYALGTLPFVYNANWSGDQPKFELRIETADARAEWYITQTLEEDWRVVLPNFSDAPWKEPVLETRGGEVEFNAKKFAAELGEALGLECCSWAAHLEGLVKIRAFALLVSAFEGQIEPCLLTDHENFDEAEDGKWCIGDWRFYLFTQSPSSSWPYGEQLCELIEAYTSGDDPYYVLPNFPHAQHTRQEFEVLVACGRALHEPEFTKFLERFDLAPDFELGVFDFDDRECNFAREENWDLSGLEEV